MKKAPGFSKGSYTSRTMRKRLGDPCRERQIHEVSCRCGTRPFYSNKFIEKKVEISTDRNRAIRLRQVAGEPTSPDFRPVRSMLPLQRLSTARVLLSPYLSGGALGGRGLFVICGACRHALLRLLIAILCKTDRMSPVARASRNIPNQDPILLQKGRVDSRSDSSNIIGWGARRWTLQVCLPQR